MSTSSEHLNLIVPDDSDPFLRTDFVSNYDKLDQYPGRYICTSATRPSWGSAQAGMWIVQTDTRSELQWSGTAWNEPQTVAPAWYATLTPNIILSGVQTVVYTFATVNLRRPATIIGMYNVNAYQPSNLKYPAAVGLTPLIDGTYAGNYPSNGPDYVQWPPSGGDTNLWNDYRVTPTMCLRAVAAGTHTLSLSITSGPPDEDYSVTEVKSMRLVAWLANSTDV